MREGEIRALGQIAGRSIARPSAVARDVHGAVTRRQIASQFGNTPVGATESIFVDMSYSTGLKLISPPEFMQALSEGNDPSAQDIVQVVPGRANVYAGGRMKVVGGGQKWQSPVAS